MATTPVPPPSSPAPAPAAVSFNTLKSGALIGLWIGLAIAISVAVLFGSFAHFFQIVILMVVWSSIASIRNAAMGVVQPVITTLRNAAIFVAVFTALSVLLGLTTGFTLLNAFNETMKTQGPISAYFGLKGSLAVGLGYLITLCLIWITTGIVSRKTLFTPGFILLVVFLALWMIDAKYQYSTEYAPEKHTEKIVQKELKADFDQEYQSKVEKLRADRKAGNIDDAAFARGYANEKGLNEYRQQMAKDPTFAGTCHSELKLNGNVREYAIPAACESGYEFTVWPDAPQKIVKAELLSADGDLLGVEPGLVAGRGSTAKPLGNHYWLVEGNVTYRHDKAGRNRLLRITVEQ